MISMMYIMYNYIYLRDNDNRNQMTPTLPSMVAKRREIKLTSVLALRQSLQEDFHSGLSRIFWLNLLKIFHRNSYIKIDLNKLIIL